MVKFSKIDSQLKKELKKVQRNAVLNQYDPGYDSGPWPRPGRWLRSRIGGQKKAEIQLTSPGEVGTITQKKGREQAERTPRTRQGGTRA